MNLIGEKISYKPDEQFHLNDVSFNFKKGNLYTILGRTLSGKTTLLKTIAGLLKNFIWQNDSFKNNCRIIKSRSRLNFF